MKIIKSLFTFALLFAANHQATKSNSIIDLLNVEKNINSESEMRFVQIRTADALAQKVLDGLAKTLGTKLDAIQIAKLRAGKLTSTEIKALGITLTPEQIQNLDNAIKNLAADDGNDDDKKKLDSTKVDAIKNDKKAVKSTDEIDRKNLRIGKKQVVLTSMFSVHRDMLHPGAYKEMNGN